MKLIEVNDWNIVEHRPESGSRSYFSVIISDPNIASKQMQVRLPYSSIIDTTISPETHDLFIHISNKRTNSLKINRNDIFFREKTSRETGGPVEASMAPNSPAGSVFGGVVSQKRRSLLDSSGSGFTVGGDTTAIGAQGQETIIGKKGMTITSGSPRVFDFPTQDNVLLKQNPLGAIAPRCFVPPFCFPQFLPNLQSISQITGVIKTLKLISAITRTL